VLDVPFTFENRLPQAIEIANWGSHDLMGRFAAHPPHLAREIRSRFGRHPMGYEIPVNKGEGQLHAMRRELIAGAEKKGGLARWLRETTPWDFFLAVFGECHRGGHILWRDPDDEGSQVPAGGLLEVYRAVDVAVGHLLDGVDLDTTTVVVFALHGMGRNVSQEHVVRRTMDRVNAAFQDGSQGVRERARKQGGPMRALRESVPARMQHAIARAVPVEVRDWVVSRETTGGLDWSRVPGFALRSDLYSFLRLNLEGREREGLLQRDGEACRRYVEWMTAAFRSLRVAETGAPIIRDVVKAQEIFPGARSDLLPDFILRWSDERPTSRVSSPLLGEIEAAPDRGRTGEHNPGGFALVLGAALRQGSLPPLAHNRDFRAFVNHFFTRP
jgi:predicted AlkP superfamily phosphohydrolase/phosphomutase